MRAVLLTLHTHFLQHSSVCVWVGVLHRHRCVVLCCTDGDRCVAKSTVTIHGDGVKKDAPFEFGVDGTREIAKLQREHALQRKERVRQNFHARDVEYIKKRR